MRRRTSGRRGFTLAELIMAIALLAVFSVFIVQMFAKADQLSRKARSLDQAVVCAANLADQWRMDGTEDVPLAVLQLRLNRADKLTATVNLDSHFQLCEEIQTVYVAVLTLQPGQDDSGAAVPGLWQLSVEISPDGPSDSGPIYALQTSRYFPEEVSAP